MEILQIHLGIIYYEEITSNVKKRKFSLQELKTINILYKSFLIFISKSIHLSIFFIIKQKLDIEDRFFNGGISLKEGFQIRGFP